MIYLLSLIIGAVVGSFVNVVILRLAGGKSLLWPPSHCPHCRHRLALFDLIPVISFIFLRGHCRYCRQKISWQYPLVEAATSLLFLAATIIGVYHQAIPHPWYGLDQFCFFSSVTACINFFPELLRDWLVIVFLIIIFVYDLKWRLILDRVVLPAIAIVFIFNLLLGANWLNLVLAAAVGGGFFALQFLLSRGRWIGGGDLRVGALLGVLLGWPAVILAIFLAYIAGAIVSVILIIVKGRKLASEIPFAVFLAPAALFTLWFGERIISWYLGLF